MPLTWDATDVVINGTWEEQDEVWCDDVANFCFTLMAICVSSVNEKNVGEVYTRIQILHALNGPLRYHYEEFGPGIAPRKNTVYTWDFVKSMVGYKTNASNKTFLQWTKDFSTAYAKEYQGRYEKDKTKVLS